MDSGEGNNFAEEIAPHVSSESVVADSAGAAPESSITVEEVVAETDHDGDVVESEENFVHETVDIASNSVESALKNIEEEHTVESSATIVASSEDKLLQRAARFGAISSEAQKKINDEKLSQRAARFGIVPKDPVKEDNKRNNQNKKGNNKKRDREDKGAERQDGSKIQKRVERFGAISEQAKIDEAKKRQEQDVSYTK